jgi:hypothetical protein
VGRKRGNARWRANAGNAWRLRSTDETSRLPSVAIKAKLRRFCRVSLRVNNFRREVGDGQVKLECVNDTSGLPLPTSRFVVSGVPGASPVDRGRARGVGHRIRPGWTEGGFGAHGWKRKRMFSAPQKPLAEALKDAAGDVLTLVFDLIFQLHVIYCVYRFAMQILKLFAELV